MDNGVLRVMFDSVDITHLPGDAEIVAGYVDGEWPTFDQLKAKFPRARRVSIAVSAQREADVLDVEKGDATPQDVPGWVTRMRDLDRVPIVYTSRVNIGLVDSACNADHVAPPFYWVADWTGGAHLVSGSVATQWADGSAKYPGLAKFCDTSSVSPNFPEPFKTEKATKGGTVKIPSLDQISSLVHRAAAIATIVVAYLNNIHAPTGVRAVAAAGASAVLVVERYLQSSKSAG
jgi:hypothetical protein